MDIKEVGKKVFKEVLYKGVSGVAILFVVGFFMVNTKHLIEINYVSQNELEALEKERISKLPLVERELYFGRVDEAVKMIKSEVEWQNAMLFSKAFITKGAVFGKNVKSISQQVHSKVISQLEANRKAENVKKAKF